MIQKIKSEAKKFFLESWRLWRDDRGDFFVNLLLIFLIIFAFSGLVGLLGIILFSVISAAVTTHRIQGLIVLGVILLILFTIMLVVLVGKHLEAIGDE